MSCHIGKAVYACLEQQQTALMAVVQIRGTDGTDGSGRERRAAEKDTTIVMMPSLWSGCVKVHLLFFLSLWFLCVHRSLLESIPAPATGGGSPCSSGPQSFRLGKGPLQPLRPISGV
jgi:hypothetical protein